jgi:hypothetical protein
VGNDFDDLKYSLFSRWLLLHASHHTRRACGEISAALSEMRAAGCVAAAVTAAWCGGTCNGSGGNSAKFTGGYMEEGSACACASDGAWRSSRHLATRCALKTAPKVCSLASRCLMAISEADLQTNKTRRNNQVVRGCYIVSPWLTHEQIFVFFVFRVRW